LKQLSRIRRCSNGVHAGSPILSRQGWRELLSQQGFSDVLVAGENRPAPTLLSRQSVIVGVSDGAIRIARMKNKKAAAAAKSLTAAAKPSAAAPLASRAPLAAASVVQVRYMPSLLPQFLTVEANNIRRSAHSIF
jgi:hypothetical protein